MKVSVLGAGNGAYGIAFHMVQLGHEVLMHCPEAFKSDLQPVDDAGCIIAVRENNGYNAALHGTSLISKVTTDMKEACLFSDVLILIMPSFGHKPTFESALPYLTANHILVCLPGNFFFVEATEIVKSKTGADVTKDLPFTIVEAVSIPYCIRKIDSNKVFIVGSKNSLPIGVYPSSRSVAAKNIIQPLFSLNLTLLENALHAGLYNPNIVLHPSILIYNAGWVESKKGDFYFYKEAVTPGICSIMSVLDEERCKVVKALGLKVEDMLSVLKACYDETTSQSYEEYFRDAPQYDGIKSPSCFNTRYVTEDFEYSFLPIFSYLSKKYKVETPLADAVALSAKILSGIELKIQRNFQDFPRSFNDI